MTAPPPLGSLEERRQAARAQVEDLEAGLERLEGELGSARAVLEHRAVAVEELAEVLALSSPRIVARLPRTSWT
ncbi:hypothetical protein [Kitasatospora kifunensis]|uniref:Uncharacterized protein n=1 Tax=Kitasatospora kifunensis TaxID=58351 RepID=A0A7W7VZJ9_KITKI|nr:hypothetical protein [Kitasatospora kifunensis]MBB4928168.1 hypothetical protein [Kitasatospora kifunensis]